MDVDKAKAICVLLAKEGSFQGLYMHCGNAYHANSAAEVVSVRQTSAQRLFKLAKEINRAGVTVSSLAVGSTPTLSQKVSLEAQQQLQKLSEAHPGNYIFYGNSKLRCIFFICISYKDSTNTVHSKHSFKSPFTKFLCYQI